MTLYQKFKKLRINFSAIEFEQAGDDDKYFCTPKGAHIIGRADVDGIHYCFVRGQGEMVFAVNPSNDLGKNVYPIANTFEELLSLLLSCGSMAVIEQAHLWDEEQFEEFVAENQPTQAQVAVFHILRDKLGITPMDEPFTYLRRLQDSYNYSELNYSKKYYELFNTYLIDEIPSEWKVTLDGGFYLQRGKSGKEIILNKKAIWGDEIWQLPAAYQFSGGFVVNFCIQVNTERVKKFFCKYRHLEEQGIYLSEEDEMKIRSECPTDVNIRPQLIVNDEKMRNLSSQGETWIFADIVGDDTWEDKYGQWRQSSF